ncbi:hypothetical protein [Lacinutrix undariae]
MKQIYSKIIRRLTILIKYLSYSEKAFINEKQVYFNIENPSIYNRYIYTLAKFFTIEGYDVVFSKTFKHYRLMHQNDSTYLGLLSKTENVYFSNKTPQTSDLVFNDENLNANYFSFLIETKKRATFIPIAQHPLMYDHKLWNTKIADSLRKNSIFMIGNFDENSYKNIENTSLNIISRPKIYKHLETSNLLTQIVSESDFNSFLNSDIDKKCVVIKRDDFSIKMEHLRPTLTKFNFFLACPGYIMPYAHNIVEALSVATIPIIQTNYATLFFPPLEHNNNAILFDDLPDLTEKIKNCYALNTEEIKILQNNAFNYYINYLTPKSVINTIEKQKTNTFYLIAEAHSIKLFEAQKNASNN